MRSRKNRRAHEKRVRAHGVAHILVAQDEVGRTRALSLYLHSLGFPSSLLSGRGPPRGLPLSCFSCLSCKHADIFRHSYKVVVDAVDHRVGAGDADVGCDIANVSTRGLPLFMCTATSVIVEVTVPIAVSGGMDVDDPMRNDILRMVS
jgi:hypothetical protein